MMTAHSPQDRWLEVQEVLDQVLDLEAERQIAALDTLCGDDVELRREVETYLGYEERATQFLERPLFELAGQGDEDRQGELLGPYRLDAPIARGGMGTVYRATRVDGVFDRRVAVKILRRGFDTDSFVRGFHRERQILAGFTHESIVRLIDGGATGDGLPYLVMEAVEGSRLDELCDRNEASLTQRLTLFTKLCEAVQTAHARLIVHCDLKPSNVLVSDQGELKLLDFGIAKILEAEDGAAGVLGRALGTPPYASPEQVRGEPLSTATDVYSLGCILYRLLAGKPPPTAEVRQQERRSLLVSEAYAGRVGTLGGEPTETRRMVRRLRGDLDSIVRKAMAVDPTERYLTAAELGDDVRRSLEHHPVTARPASPWYVGYRFVRRHRLSVALAVSLFLSLAGGAIGLYSQLTATIEQRDRAVALEELYLEFLELVDPSRGESEAEALQTAFEKLGPGLRHLPPENQVTLLDRISRLLDRLEYWGEARDLQLKVLDLRRTVLPWNPRLVAASLNNLAVIEINLGNEVRARELLNEALALHRDLDVASEVGFFDALNNLALAIQKAEPAEAEALFRRVLVGQDRFHGRDSPEVAKALNNLGQVLVRQGKIEEGLPLLEEALERRVVLLGEDHRETLVTQSNLAVALAADQRYGPALALARGLLRHRRMAFGDDNPSTARARNALAFILLQEGRGESLAEAEGHLHEAIRIYEGLGEASAATHLVFERNLVAVRVAQGRFTTASRALKTLLPRAVTVFGEDSWRLAELRSLEGEVLLAQGDRRRARGRILDNYETIVAGSGLGSVYSRAAERRIRQLEAVESSP